MKTVHKNSYLTLARRIGDDIIQESRLTKNGRSLKTLSHTKHNTPLYRIQESIYSGIAGIALFLIYLGYVYADSTYYTAAGEFLTYLTTYTKKHPTTFYSFLTGRLGTAYVALQYQYYTNDTTFEKFIKYTALQSRTFLATNPPVDYLNGIGGTTLALTHINHILNNDEISSLTAEMLTYILKKIQREKTGIAFDPSYRQIRPLCGLSHGASGAATVLLELGSYFKLPELYILAEECFAYENQFISESRQNWPDFRLSLYDNKKIEEASERVSKGEKDFLIKPGDMRAWCHGAPGIGLVRLSAYEKLKKKQWLKDTQRALSATIPTLIRKNIRSFSLCHGACGNAELLIEAARKFPSFPAETILTQLADEIGTLSNKSLTLPTGYQRFAGYKDQSLFLGNTGIGYFLLRLADQRIPSILYPSLPPNTASKTLPIQLKPLKVYLTKTQADKRRIAIGERVESQGLAWVRQNIAADYVKNNFNTFSNKNSTQQIRISETAELYIKRRHEKNTHFVDALINGAIHSIALTTDQYRLLEHAKKPCTFHELIAFGVKTVQEKKYASQKERFEFIQSALRYRILTTEKPNC